MPSSGLQPLPDTKNQIIGPPATENSHGRRAHDHSQARARDLSDAARPLGCAVPAAPSCLLSFMPIFLAVLGYGVFAPSYQAHMNVLVRRGRVDPLVTPAPTPSPMLQRDEISEEELNSQVELLRDDEILRTVVQVPGLDGAPWYERFLGGS